MSSSGTSRSSSCTTISSDSSLEVRALDHLCVVHLEHARERRNGAEIPNRLGEAVGVDGVVGLAVVATERLSGGGRVTVAVRLGDNEHDLADDGYGQHPEHDKAHGGASRSADRTAPYADLTRSRALRARSIREAWRSAREQALRLRGLPHDVERGVEPGPDPKRSGTLPDQDFEPLHHGRAPLPGRVGELGLARAVDEIDDD